MHFRARTVWIAVYVDVDKDILGRVFDYDRFYCTVNSLSSPLFLCVAFG